MYYTDTLWFKRGYNAAYKSGNINHPMPTLLCRDRTSISHTLNNNIILETCPCAEIVLWLIMWVEISS